MTISDFLNMITKQQILDLGFSLKDSIGNGFKGKFEFIIEKGKQRYELYYDTNTGMTNLSLLDPWFNILLGIYIESIEVLKDFLSRSVFFNPINGDINVWQEQFQKN